MEASLRFYRDTLGLALVVDRVVTENYVFEILGIAPGTLRLVILAVPGSDASIELIQMSEDNGPPSPGSTHVCVYVSDLDDLIPRLVHIGARTRSLRPVLITAGPNAGHRAIYVTDPDGYWIELFEPPGGPTGPRPSSRTG
jgi:catechol 2,3-dioxygenase-like lactoylglutathione lyase family enzyme